MATWSSTSRREPGANRVQRLAFDQGFNDEARIESDGIRKEQRRVLKGEHAARRRPAPMRGRHR
jgi:hypothetical protein